MGFCHPISHSSDFRFFSFFPYFFFFIFFVFVVSYYFLFVIRVLLSLFYLSFFFNPKRWKIGEKRRRNGKLMRKNGGTTQKKRAKNSKVYKTSKHGSGRPRRSNGRRWLQIGRKEPRIVISPRLKCA